MSAKKVLIIGGGIAGISLASFLQDSDYDITLIERAPEWRTIGFAVGLWANGVNLLRRIVPEGDFWKHTTVVEKGAILDPKGNIICEIPKSKLKVPEIARTVERDLLHKAITGTLLKK